MNQPRPLTSIIGLVLGAGLLSGLVWGNYQFAHKNVGGSGFFIQWIGIRSLVTGGEDPYDEAVTARIQAAVKTGVVYQADHPARYTSPLYSGVVAFPFAIIGDRSLAHALWFSAQLMAIFTIVLLGIRLTSWKPPWYLLLIFSLITTFSYHVFVPWLDGSMAIWASLFLALALTAILNNWNELGGIFLAFSAVHPPMILLVLLLVLIWAASHKRRVLILWFFITLIVLSIIGLLLTPDWLQQYLRLLYNYRETIPGSTLGVFLKLLWPGLGKQLSWLVTALTAGILLVEWWVVRKRDFRWFIWTVCLTLVISQWIGIPTTPDNLISLLLPFMLVASMLMEHWPRGGKWLTVIVIIGLFLWEWALVFRDVTSPGETAFLNLLIPLPAVLLVGLYWVRWWAIKPKHLFLEELRYGEIR